MKISVLIENETIDKNLKAQHGLSLLLECNGKNLLFDTGADGTFLKNAQKMNNDTFSKIESIDGVIVSHQHSDHTGGLDALNRVNDHAPIYGGVFDGKYTAAKIFNFLYANIGLRAARSVLQRFRYIQEDQEIFPGIRLIKGFSQEGFLPPGNVRLYVKPLVKPLKGHYVPDDFSHEIALLVTEGDKNYLITGCSHNGIGNMIQTVMERYQLKRLDAVFGGFHVKRMLGEGVSQNSLELLGEELDKYKDTVYYTGHCTGGEAFDFLKNKLKDRLNPLNTGMVIEV